MELEMWLSILEEKDASDLHLCSQSYPYLRINGEITRVEEYGILKTEELKKTIYSVLSDYQIKEFEKKGNIDFGIENGRCRFRCNVYRHLKGIGVALRKIPSEIKSFSELGLPPVLEELSMQRKGLVVVTGPAGSGKSTTLASMIHHINRNRKAHIITIEDPIEFVHEDINCLINQREVGRDTLSFADALRSALREDPDVILVGEMRDLETISLAIEASSTGHLVLSTLHTIGSAKTVDRMIDVFPSEEQNHIRSLLADVIAGVVSQILFKRKDNSGRIPAVEVMVATTAIRNLIREGKTHQIPSIIETGSKYGMKSMVDSITNLVQKGLISQEDALYHLSALGRG